MIPTNSISDDQRYSLFTVKVKFIDTKVRPTPSAPEATGWQPFHSWKQERYENDNMPLCDQQLAYKRMKRLITHELYSPYRCAMLYLNVTREGKICKSKEDKGTALYKFVYGRPSPEIMPSLQFRETKYGIVLDNFQVEIRQGVTMQEIFRVQLDQKDLNDHVQMNYVFWKKKMEEHFFKQKKNWNREQAGIQTQAPL